MTVCQRHLFPLQPALPTSSWNIHVLPGAEEVDSLQAKDFISLSLSLSRPLFCGGPAHILIGKESEGCCVNGTPRFLGFTPSEHLSPGSVLARAVHVPWSGDPQSVSFINSNAYFQTTIQSLCVRSALRRLVLFLRLRHEIVSHGNPFRFSSSTLHSFGTFALSITQLRKKIQ